MKEPGPVVNVSRRDSRVRRPWLRVPQGPQGALMGAAAAIAAALWFLPGTLPAPLVLPVVSTLLLLAAALIALVAWWRPAPHPSLPGYWDVSGALTMAGIGAALLSEPDAVLPLLEAHWPTEKTRH